MRQVAKNLSLARANAVRSSFIQYGKDHGINIDQSQFIAIGRGVEAPKFTRPAPRRNGRPIVACASSSSRSRRSSRSSSRLATEEGGVCDVQTDESPNAALLVATLAMALMAAAQSQTEGRQATQAGEAS